MGGFTADSKDFNDTMKSHVPLVFGFVLTAAFLLLLVTFRSIVIPIKAIVLNLLSVGAAYGVLVWIFQEGHLESLLGFQSNGAIVSWMPLFLFVVLFGLSMDYHVFILTRIREAFDRGRPTEEAVAHGIKTTAGVVTSAAVVMIAVFAIFATLSLLIFKQLGVGLAVAVLIDATIIRGVLLPATMKLLGDWNWYLPRWLEWLPHVSPEGSRGLPPEAAEAAGARGPGAASGLGATQISSESRRIDVGDAAAPGLRRRPDRDQPADRGDRSADPDPADQRVDVDPEVRRRRVRQVALLDRPDREPLQVAERLSGLAFVGETPRASFSRRRSAPLMSGLSEVRSGCIAVHRSLQTVVFRPTSLVASPSKKLRTGPAPAWVAADGVVVPGRVRGWRRACRPWSR